MLRRTLGTLFWGAATPRASSGWTASPVATYVAPPSPERQLREAEATSFVQRASVLKRKMPGTGHYAFARSSAQHFLDVEVPKKAELESWMATGGNAVALAEVLNFFQIEPEVVVASSMLRELVRCTGDGASSPILRLNAAICLLNLRPAEHAQRALETVVQLLQQHRPAATVTGVEVWEFLGCCAKILQKCGARVPPALTEELVEVVMNHYQAVAAPDVVYIKRSLLRIYAWMARAGRREANQLLYTLVEQVGDFNPTDFCTLVLACERHNQSIPLPVELMERLTRTASSYGFNSSAHQLSFILSALAKLLHSLTPGQNEVTTAAVHRVRDLFLALLEECRARVLRFMDPGDKVYWSGAAELSVIVFAYELGGHRRFHDVFAAYTAYVERHVTQTFEPPQLALATGILRRSQRLTPALLSLLSQRIEVVLGELRLVELSHIVATFAAVPGSRPRWWSEARAIVLRQCRPTTSGIVRLNIAIAFPEEPDLVSGVDYASITSKQLVDVLPLVLGSTAFEAPVMAALRERLQRPVECFSADELRVVLASSRQGLVQAAQEHLHGAFSQPVWNSDTLYALELVCDPQNVERNGRDFDVVKALEAAKVASVSPNQFCFLAGHLLDCFGDRHTGIRDFVQLGGKDILKSDSTSNWAAIDRYLTMLRRHPSLAPDATWLGDLAEYYERHHYLLSGIVEELLLSLRTLYKDVAKTPVLQPLLSSLVERTYPHLLSNPEGAARVTVLLVHLLHGATVPILTAAHPVVREVLAKEASYTPEVRHALSRMPLSQEVAATEERRGRFVLKRVPAPQQTADAAAALLDLNTGDPFELAPAVEAAPAETLAPPVEGDKPVLAPAATSSPAEEAPVAAAEPVEERPMSYYAKFFSTSVGQLLTGRGTGEEVTHDAAQATPNQVEPTVAAAVAESPKPRRTRLQPSSHATATVSETTATPAAAAPSTTVVTAPSHTAATPTSMAVPVSTFTTAWGTPAAAAPNPAQGWSFAAQHHHQQHHNTAFNSLFGASSAPPSAAVTHSPTPALAVAPVTAPPPSAPAPAAAPRTTVVGGNNIFMDPSKTTDERARPAMTRRAVITRVGSPAAAASHGASGSHSAAAAPPHAGHAEAVAVVAERMEEEDIRRIYADATPVAQVLPNFGVDRHLRPQIVLDAGAVPPPEKVVRRNAPVLAPAGGMTDFMHKAGLTKITGYNIDTEAPITAPTSTPPPVHSTRPAMDWEAAARSVARVTRYPRGKAKSRGQESLSAWLNTPAARLDAAAAARETTRTAITAAAAPPSPPVAAVQAAAVPAPVKERQTTVAEAVHRRRPKRKTKSDSASAAGSTAANGVSAPASAAKELAPRGRGRRTATGPAVTAATNAGRSGKAAATAAKTSAAAAGRRGGKSAKAVPKKAATTKAAASPKKSNTRAVKTNTAKAAKSANAAKPTKATNTSSARGKRGGGEKVVAAAVKSAKKTVKAAVTTSKKVAPTKKKMVGKGRKK